MPKIPIQVEPTDEMIISSILAGHRNDYELLVQRYHAQLYKTAQGILSDYEDIQDALQEAYLSAFENLGNFRKESKFSTWLTRILINCALQKWNARNKKKVIQIDEIDVALETHLHDFISLDDKAEVSYHILHLINKAIDNLPVNLKTIFILRQVQGVSVSETASILGLSQENVKIRHHRAKFILRNELNTAAVLMSF